MGVMHLVRATAEMGYVTAPKPARAAHLTVAAVATRDAMVGEPQPSAKPGAATDGATAPRPVEPAYLTAAASPARNVRVETA